MFSHPCRRYERPWRSPSPRTCFLSVTCRRACFQPRPEAVRAFVARAAGVVAGTRCAEQACAQLDAGLEVTWSVHDGGEVSPGGVIGQVEGPLRSLLTAERTALNFLCHLSGVATATRSYVEAAREANPR